MASLEASDVGPVSLVNVGGWLQTTRGASGYSSGLTFKGMRASNYHSACENFSQPPVFEPLRVV